MLLMLMWRARLDTLPGALADALIAGVGNVAVHVVFVTSYLPLCVRQGHAGGPAAVGLSVDGRKELLQTWRKSFVSQILAECADKPSTRSLCQQQRGCTADGCVLSSWSSVVEEHTDELRIEYA
jgi:hypothetical protein